MPTVHLRYTGLLPRSEADITGIGKRWWPGEIRSLDAGTRVNALVAANKGWKLERGSDVPDLVQMQAVVSGDGNFVRGSRAMRAYLLGDSICADAYAGGIWTGWGWMAWARRYLGRKLDMPASRMLAVGGATVGRSGTQQATNNVLYGQLPNVVQGAADFAIVGVGINSLGASTTDTLISEYTQIFDTLRSLGLGLVILEIRAKGSGAPITGDNLLQAARLNRWFRSYAAANRGVAVFAQNPVYLDFSTGYAQTAMLRDDLHDTQLGAMTMGKAFADWLSPLLLAVDDSPSWLGDVYDATKNPSGNLLTNGLLSGTGGTTINGATGSVPTGWRGARSSGAATHTAAFGVTTDATYPTLPRCTITIGGTGDSNSAFLDQEVDRTATVAAGDLVYAEALVDWTVTTAGLRAIALQCVAKNSGYAAVATAWDGYANTATYGYMPAGAGAVLLRTEPIMVPAGFKYLTPVLYVYSNTSGTPNSVVGVKRMALRKAV